MYNSLIRLRKSDLEWGLITPLNTAVRRSETLCHELRRTRIASILFIIVWSMKGMYDEEMNETRGGDKFLCSTHYVWLVKPAVQWMRPRCQAYFEWSFGLPDIEDICVPNGDGDAKLDNGHRQRNNPLRWSSIPPSSLCWLAVSWTWRTCLFLLCISTCYPVHFSFHARLAMASASTSVSIKRTNRTSKMKALHSITSDIR